MGFRTPTPDNSFPYIPSDHLPRKITPTSSWKIPPPEQRRSDIYQRITPAISPRKISRCQLSAIANMVAVYMSITHRHIVCGEGLSPNTSAMWAKKCFLPLLMLSLITILVNFDAFYKCPIHHRLQNQHHIRL